MLLLSQIGGTFNFWPKLHESSSKKLKFYFIINVIKKILRNELKYNAIKEGLEIQNISFRLSFGMPVSAAYFKIEMHNIFQ